MIDQETHPWASAREHFNASVLPRLRQHGKAIGAAASTGDERAREIMGAYELLYRSFDPITLTILDEKLSAYLANKNDSNGEAFGGARVERFHDNGGEGFPKEIITISNADQTGRVHPTQKPVALMEYLIKTYTNGGETVLDSTMGSGTTGVACANTARSFIGIERDPDYFQIASDRIAAAAERNKSHNGQTTKDTPGNAEGHSRNDLLH